MSEIKLLGQKVTLSIGQNWLLGQNILQYIFFLFIDVY